MQAFRSFSKVVSRQAGRRDFSALVFADHNNVSLSASTLHAVAAAAQVLCPCQSMKNLMNLSASTPTDISKIA
jgi:hypothetical protein